MPWQVMAFITKPNIMGINGLYMRKPFGMKIEMVVPFAYFYVLWATTWRYIALVSLKMENCLMGRLTK